MRHNELHSLLPANTFRDGVVFPHLVVRFPSIQVLRYATSTFVWLESYDVRQIAAA